MNRTMIGVGVGLGALALGGIVYSAVDRQRRRRTTAEDAERVAAWEDEGGALRQGPQLEVGSGAEGAAASGAGSGGS